VKYQAGRLVGKGRNWARDLSRRFISRVGKRSLKTEKGSPEGGKGCLSGIKKKEREPENSGGSLILFQKKKRKLFDKEKKNKSPPPVPEKKGKFARSENRKAKGEL